MPGEENEFDRQAFVRQETSDDRPPRPGAGPLLFLVVMALVTVAGFGAFRYLTHNAPDLGLQGDVSSQLLARLEEIEQRLARLERQRQSVHARADTTLPDLPGPSPAKTPGKESTANVATNAGSPDADDRQGGSVGSQQPPMPSADVSRESDAWDAASNRIADVVGELGTQRKAMAENRRSLDELRGRLDRAREEFRVTKSMGKVRIGSVWLRLLNTQAEQQVYSLRVYMDDKTIELRGRALYEPIQLFPAGASMPFELIVSEILKNEVSGYMALPNLPQRDQERK